MQRDKEFSGIYKRGLETAENVDRKDFTPSEAVKAWQEIEALKGGRGKTRSESDGVSPRDQASKLTGLGIVTLSKAKQVEPVKQADNRLINRIALGNNVDILPEIESNSIDLILTDPPYITALADLYKSWNFKNHDFEFYAEQFDRVLKDTGNFVTFADLQTAVAIFNGFNKHFAFRFNFTWIKSNGQPCNKFMPRLNTELILVFKKKNCKTSDLTFNPIFEKGLPYVKKHKAGNKTRKQEKDYITVNTTGDRYPSQTLYYPSKDNLPQAERTDHPTQKAINLIGYLIKTLSNEGDIVLDPFSGSGSTAIACHRLKRNFIAIEKDPEYYIESIGRLERERCQITLPF